MSLDTIVEMKTYIINLEQSTERKEYMRQQMKKLPQLDYEFIPAVDGRKMSEEELSSRFNMKGSMYHYGRELMKGEVGCTLSHIRCYQRIVAEDDSCALILEDDIEVNHPEAIDISFLENFLVSCSKPVIVLLSGHYWYTSRYHSQMVNVFSAFYTHAYVVNQAAARLLLNKLVYPWHLADDWFYIRSLGVKLLGLKPHWINQISTDATSTVVNAELPIRALVKRNLCLKSLLISYYVGGVKKLLKFFNLYESD